MTRELSTAIRGNVTVSAGVRGSFVRGYITRGEVQQLNIKRIARGLPKVSLDGLVEPTTRSKMPKAKKAPPTTWTYQVAKAHAAVTRKKATAKNVKTKTTGKTGKSSTALAAAKAKAAAALAKASASQAKAKKK